jgi:hypothetical protein
MITKTPTAGRSQQHDEAETEVQGVLRVEASMTKCNANCPVCGTQRVPPLLSSSAVQTRAATGQAEHRSRS